MTLWTGQIIKNLMIGTVLFCVSSCGNNWIPPSNSNSASNLYVEGKKASDARDFATAVDKFTQALQIDSANYDLRLRLAYAYNGLAGLDAVTLYLNLNSSKSAQLESEISGLGEISSLLGFTSTDREEFRKKIEDDENADIETIRSFSTKLTSLHEGWKVVCLLLPNSTLQTYVFDSDESNRLLDGNSCLSGTVDSQSPASASFAAVLQVLMEAVVLYQTVFDTNDDGKVDFVEDATAVNNKIKTIKSGISTASGSQVTSLMSSLNSNLSKLSEIGKRLKSDSVMTGILDFSLVSALVQNLSGVPEDLKTQVTNGAGKLTDAKSIIDGFTSEQNSESGATASANTASQAMKDLSAKINSLSGAEKQAAEEQFNQACTQFDAVKDVYGLPASAQKPDECQ